MTKKKIILVTGLLRSGTTWTGKMIALAHGVKYVNEPFNLDRGRKNCPLRYWYQYLDAMTSAEEQHTVKSYLDSIFDSPFFYLSDQIKQFRKYKAYSKIWNLLLKEKKNFTGRPLMKDPIAILSAEWLYDQYDAAVIVVLRHPAAFIGSLKAAGWSLPFSDLLAQEKQLAGIFPHYFPLVKQYASNPPDVIDQGILMWNMMYHRIHYYHEKYGNKWYFVKHEELSRNPVDEFRKVFEYLSIPMNDSLRQKIVHSSDGSKIDRLSRNSVENLETWKKRLTNDEITRIKTGTAPLYALFYSENEWG